MASLDGMRDRTITINGMSKTYSVTGWRVGWAIAPPEASIPIRKVHDFLTVGAAAPLQQAGAVALELPPSYYQKLAETYLVKRDRMLGILTDAGFRCFKPAGAYYIMTDISDFNFPDDHVFLEISSRENRNRRRARFELLRRSRPWARARSASRSARKNRRWPPARKSCRSSAPPSARNLR